MALALADRIKETTNVTGTDPAILLGSPAGFQTFSVVGDANTTYYCISEQAGLDWEVGIGTYSTIGPTLTRTTILRSSNSDSIVDFLVGTKDIFVTIPAEKGIWYDVSDNLNVSGQIISTLSTGTSPFSVTSTTPVENLNIGGNANTASKLETAVNINGVSFDGSESITIVDSTALANAASASLYANTGINNAASASAYANTGINNAASASLYANTGINNAASASAYANTGINNAASASAYANTGINNAASASLYANTANTTATTAVNNAASASLYANTGINNAASASLYANNALSFLSSNNTLQTNINLTQNTNITTAVNNAASASLYANTGINNVASASLYANTGINNAASASSYANTGINNAASASSYANTGINNAASASAYANTGINNAASASSYANTANTTATTSVNNAASASSYANTGINNAASASSYANTGINNAASASLYANTKVSKSGDTMTGPLIISDTTSGSLQVAGTVTISKDLNVTGNIFISGNTTTINSESLTLSDPIIYLAGGNIANTSDIGFVGHVTNGHYYHTGLVRDHVDGTWKFFSNVSTEPTTTINFSEANTVYDVIKVGGVVSPSALINGIELGAYTQLSFDKANTATNNAASASLYANTGINNAASSSLYANTGINNAASASLYANNALTYLSSNNTLQTNINLTQNTNITTATNNAASASLYANTGINNAASASLYANTGINNAASASLYANTGVNNAASASSYANTGINNAASASAYANTGINNAASASLYANNALTYLSSNNTINAGINLTQNTNITTATNNAASASLYANTGINNASSASAYANTGINNAASASSYANTANTTATTAVNNAASASLYANTGINNAASASSYANTGINNAASASLYANTGINNAASASLYANTGINNAASASLYANTAVTDDTTTATTHYPLLSIASSGTLLSANTSSSKLTYIPNTGTLSSTQISSANVSYTGTLTGGTGVIAIGTNQIYKDASGNVGIGIIPSAWNSVSLATQVKTASVWSVNNRTYLGANYYYDSVGNKVYINSAYASEYAQINGTHSWSIAPTGTAGATVALTPVMTIDNAGNVGIGISSGLTYKLQVVGSFAATTKSFLIDHPTKEGMKLRYGSLEGPENGVYIRGRLNRNNIIELPEYWTKLIDEDSITVNLTPIGKHQKLYVTDIVDNTVIIGNDNLLQKEINCFYTVFAERIDVEKLIVEIE